MITVANGSRRQACTVVIAASALFGSPSHCGGLNSSTSDRWMSVQFTTEKSESKIQRKPIVESATGAAQGSRIRKRTNHLPRKSRIEEVGEDRGADDDDRVREQREDDRVPERGAEVRVRPLARCSSRSRRSRR